MAICSVQYQAATHVRFASIGGEVHDADRDEVGRGSFKVSQ
jgi:hypothetical protein